MVSMPWRTHHTKAYGVTKNRAVISRILAEETGLEPAQAFT